MPIGIPGWPELAFCTASIASARIALARSFLVAMTPLREHKKSRQTGIDDAGILARIVRRNAGLLLGAARQLDAELLELAIEVGALQADPVGNAAHVAALATEVILEVHALEGIACLAQLAVQRQRLRGAGKRGLERGKRAGDVRNADLGSERELGHGLHH